MRDWPPCLLVQRDSGRWSRPGVSPFISALTVARCPAAFPGVCPQVRDILSRSPAQDEGRGLSYTPSLLLKPDLCLRLYATQAQPCFPAASNALALPGGNGVFTTTPTERITHYTLQAKSCAKGQAPLETPDNKTGGMLPLPGACRHLLDRETTDSAGGGVP